LGKMVKKVSNRRLPAVNAACRPGLSGRVDDIGESMEDRAKYNKEDWGKIPRTARIEYVYTIVGAAIGVLEEANAAVGEALDGEKVSESLARNYFEVTGALIRAAVDLMEAETWKSDIGRVPF